VIFIILSANFSQGVEVVLVAAPAGEDGAVVSGVIAGAEVIGAVVAGAVASGVLDAIGALLVTDESSAFLQPTRMVAVIRAARIKFLLNIQTPCGWLDKYCAVVF
jgi:hypothetical protein